MKCHKKNKIKVIFMPKHSENRKVPYSASKMFDLVSDVESYPAFLPWCSGARINCQYNADNKYVIIADLIISFKAFREQFTSEVTLDRNSNEILVNYVDGPFKYLINRWQFTDEKDDECMAAFAVDFEFKSKILQAVIGIVFNDAMIKIVGAFEKRAFDLYGLDSEL